MASSTDVSRLRVSTRDVPESQRIPFWREEFARQMSRLEFEPLSEGPLDADANLLALPDLNVGWCFSGTPARWSRTRELVKDGDDTFALIMPFAGAVQRIQRGQDLEVKPGEAVGNLHGEPGTLHFQQFDDMVLMIPRSVRRATSICCSTARARPFPQHVLAARLACAHRLLLDPRSANQSIAAIAYASGFGDLSHFNHAFRRRYGATPSEVRREQAQ